MVAMVVHQVDANAVNLCSGDAGLETQHAGARGTQRNDLCEEAVEGGETGM